MSKSSKLKKWLLIISLLGFNIVEQATSATSSTVPEMAKSFPKIPMVQIQMVTTIGAVFTMIFVFISGLVSTRVGQKKIAILGLAVSAVSSVIPAFSNNFQMILASRAVMGIGIGLANPLAISMIGEFFHGDTLNTLMGWRSSIASLGSSLMTLLAGFLMANSWHAAYWVYLMFIPILIMMIIFVPDPQKQIENSDDQNVQTIEVKEVPKNARLEVIGEAVVMFLVMASVMTFMLNLALMYVQKKIGTPTQASTMISFWSICQLIGGILFGKLYKKLGKNTLPLGLLVFGLTLALVGFANNQIVIGALMLINGTLGGLVIPYVYTRIAELSNVKTAPFNNAIALIGSNLSAFLSPYIGKILGGASAAMALRNAGLLSIAVAAVVLAIDFAYKKNHQFAL